MTTAGSFDAPIEIFGGLVTDMSPADLPHGVSPDCQEVIFSNGNVATRPGLQALFGPLAGNPTVNYVKTYETLNATLRTLALDSNGILYKEITPGTLASIATGLATGAYANSTALFGREYLAISDGKTGNDLPRQYDDTNFDRVSQTGPDAGPTVVDENVIVAIAASPSGATQPAAVTISASPNGATENRFLVTITTTSPHGLSAGQSVTVASVGVVVTTEPFPSSPCPQPRNSPTSPALRALPPREVAPPHLPPPRFKRRRLTASSSGSSLPLPASASPATTALSPSPPFPTPRISPSLPQLEASPLPEAAPQPQRVVLTLVCTRSASFSKRARVISPNPVQLQTGPPAAASAPWSPTFLPAPRTSSAGFSASAAQAGPAFSTLETVERSLAATWSSPTTPPRLSP